MPDVTTRLAELTPEKRLLLERMLDQKRETPAVRRPTRSLLASPQLPSTPPGSQEGDVKAEYRRFYDAVNRQLDAGEFGNYSFFLNFGYVPIEGPHRSRIDLPEHYLDKNSVRLILELVGDCPVAGCTVLDVGCGRGGAIAVINRFFSPRTCEIGRAHV